MTRKRWRKLVQALLAGKGDIRGQTMNDLKNAKIIHGYWSNTGKDAPFTYEDYINTVFVWSGKEWKR